MYYFASDMHLTGGLSSESRARERLLVEWLERVSVDAKAIFLVGDVFDFWFEYKRVVPKGFTRLLGKLSELTDKGISIHFFTGNHDMWQRDYLEKECGVKVHFEREVFELYGKNVSVVQATRYTPLTWAVGLASWTACSAAVRLGGFSPASTPMQPCVSDKAGRTAVAKQKR